MVKTRPSAIEINGGAHQPCEIADPSDRSRPMPQEEFAVPKAGRILLVHPQWVHIPRVAMWRHSGLGARPKLSQQVFLRPPRWSLSLARSISVRASSHEVDSVSHSHIWYRNGRRRSSRRFADCGIRVTIRDSSQFTRTRDPRSDEASCATSQAPKVFELIKILLRQHF